MEESAQKPVDTTPRALLYKEFEIEGKTLIYSYTDIRMAQMKMAEAIYGYQADLEKRPPRSLKEKIDLGGADYDQQVLSHILLLRLPDGSLQKYAGGATQKPILALVNEAPAKYARDLEDVILDFFTQRDKYTLALLVQRKYEVQYMQGVASQLNSTIQGMQSIGNSASVQPESDTSTPQQNEDAEPASA